MPQKKIAGVAFTLLLVFSGIIPTFALGDLTILYTGNTNGKIKPVHH
jgi:hypothetical protein